MFPSTTSAHTTTIHTGLPPAQSGVYEWHQYNEQLDRIITPLMFAYPRDKYRDSLLNEGLKTGDVFPARTIYRDLARAGVKSHVIIPRDIAKSAPTRALSDGATIIPYKTLPEALVNLAQLLRLRKQPSYYFVYFSNIDTICHDYGPGSAQVDAEIDAFLALMERVLLPAARNTNALLLVTADHGQVEVDPQTTLYLNHAVPNFKRFVAVNRMGELLVPAGSPRDFFLHIRSELLDEAQNAIQKAVSGKAITVKSQALIDAGFFGPQPSDAFKKRVGNLVVLPFKGESVYYYEREVFENRFYGHHGGMTREEMEIPLLACML
jgi:predicted AlkP superfamily pyrophosphatase or phosphodiesterase